MSTQVLVAAAMALGVLVLVAVGVALLLVVRSTARTVAVLEQRLRAVEQHASGLGAALEGVDGDLGRIADALAAAPPPGERGERG